VNTEWNNVDITEWNDNNNVNEVDGDGSNPTTEHCGERLHFSSLGFDDMEVQELEQVQGAGDSSILQCTRNSYDGSFLNLVHDALFDIDFNEVDVERLLE